MLNHLKTAENQVVLTRPVRNNDYDNVDGVVVGRGYGVARTLSKEELANAALSKYSHVLILVHYTPDDAAGELPQIGQVAIWKNQDFHVGGVRQHWDIHGHFAGHVLLCNT